MFSSIGACWLIWRSGIFTTKYCDIYWCDALECIWLLIVPDVEGGLFAHDDHDFLLP